MSSSQTELAAADSISYQVDVILSFGQAEVIYAKVLSPSQGIG